MPSTFFGLEIGLRALRANQRGLDVVSQNIANASNPGYSRQTANLGAAEPYTRPSLRGETILGQLGTGVIVDSITRTRDLLGDGRLRAELATSGRLGAGRDNLSQVEAIFNDTGNTGLSNPLSEFWQSWQELSNAPGDVSVRTTVIDRANALTSAIGDGYRRLQQQRVDLDTQVRQAADQVNSIAAQIADLNGSIAQVKFAGQQPNDLADRRDVLLDQLAELTRVDVTNSPSGMVSVFVGNRPLVEGTTSQDMTTTVGPGGMARVTWQRDGADVTFASGTIRGLLDQRDSVIPQMQSTLDGLASGLISAVNAAHAAGFGLDDTGPNPPGRLFFTGTGAADIAVSSDVAADPRRIAAAGSAGATGDGSGALAIAGAITSSGIIDNYRAFAAELGTRSQSATRAADSQAALVAQLQQRREETSGVSLDEETVSLLKYRQAYEASSRVVTTMDQMLDTLINRTGVVGL